MRLTGPSVFQVRKSRLVLSLKLTVLASLSQYHRTACFAFWRVGDRTTFPVVVVAQHTEKSLAPSVRSTVHLRTLFIVYSLLQFNSSSLGSPRSPWPLAISKARPLLFSGRTALALAFHSSPSAIELERASRTSEVHEQVPECNSPRWFNAYSKHDESFNREPNNESLRTTA